MRAGNWIKTSKRRLGKLLRLTWQERGILMETFLLLGFGRFLVIMLPFKKVAPHLGVINGSQPGNLSEAELVTAQQINRWVRFTSHHTPFTSNCFNKALAAHFMLRRRGISSTLYLGVAKNKEKMEAHAWLLSGDQIVTGGAEHERFTEVSHFTWQPGNTKLSFNGSP
jgi:hypothetical protein